jgi:hypothetical protein
VHGHALEQAGEARAALVGDQKHAVAAGLELRGQRVRRNPYLTRSPYVVKWSGEQSTA